MGGADGLRRGMWRFDAMWKAQDIASRSGQGDLCISSVGGRVPISSNPGGEKVSALEVEREMLSLPQVLEAAVVAVPSGKWGQKVGAVVILSPDAKGKNGGRWGPLDMRRALKERLAKYKIPQVMKVVDDIPKNAMGKSKSIEPASYAVKANCRVVNKKHLVKAVFVDEASGDEKDTLK